MGLASGWIVALGMAVGGFVLQLRNDFGPLDNFGHAPYNASVEEHFADNYYTARRRFRAQAHSAGAILHVLPLTIDGDANEMDLTIDIAVLEGDSKDQAIVHISGVHGVEAFAGSAVQSALLARRAREPAATKRAPTVIFVHALNPFGFAQLRRFNENNVDLNRNFLSPQEFAAQRAMDPNRFGYMDVFDVLNPKDATKWTASLWVQAPLQILRHGYGTLKHAIASGNYHFPESVYYGGTKQEQSVVLLLQFLQRHLDFSAMQQVSFIDVHTGLSGKTFDTILLETFSSSLMHQYAEAFGPRALTSRTGAMSGFEDVLGTSCHGFGQLFSTRDGSNKEEEEDDNEVFMCLTQEFATVPVFLVAKATVEETAMYLNYPSRRIPFAQRLRDVFYLHRSSNWKQQVIEQGVNAFEIVERVMRQRAMNMPTKKK